MEGPGKKEERKEKDRRGKKNISWPKAEDKTKTKRSLGVSECVGESEKK